MTTGPTNHRDSVRGEGVEGDEIIEVVRETVQQLEELTKRLRSFIEYDDMEV